MKHEHLHQLCEAYALGALDENEQREFQNHLQAGCDACAAKLSELNRVINALGLSAEPAAPSPELKKKIIEQATAPPPFYFVRSNEGQWQSMAPGVAAKILFVDVQHKRTTMLLPMAAGSQFAGHRHGGAEELFVLEGDCFCQGQRLHAGDYHRAEGGSTHDVTSTENGCLMLVISPEMELV